MGRSVNDDRHAVGVSRFDHICQRYIELSLSLLASKQLLRCWVLSPRPTYQRCIRLRLPLPQAPHRVREILGHSCYDVRLDEHLVLDANNLRELTNFLSIPSGHTGGGAQGKGGKAAGGLCRQPQHPSVSRYAHRFIQKFFHLHIVGVGIYHCPHHFRGKRRTTHKRLRPPGVNEWSHAEPFVNFTAEIVSHYDCLTPAFLFYTDL